MTPDFSKAEKNELASLGFSVISLHGDFFLISQDAHLSCPRNRHSCLFQVRRVPRRDPRYDIHVRESDACERRHHALPQDRSHEAIYVCIRRAVRWISPEKLVAKLRLLSSAIARPGSWYSRFVHSRVPPCGLHWTGVVQLMSAPRVPISLEKIRRKLDFRQLQLSKT